MIFRERLNLHVFSLILSGTSRLETLVKSFLLILESNKFMGLTISLNSIIFDHSNYSTSMLFSVEDTFQ